MWTVFWTAWPTGDVFLVPGCIFTYRVNDSVLNGLSYSVKNPKPVGFVAGAVESVSYTFLRKIATVNLLGSDSAGFTEFGWISILGCHCSYPNTIEARSVMSENTTGTEQVDV